MRKNHYLLSFVGQEDKDKNMVSRGHFCVQTGQREGKGAQQKFSKKTWEKCLEACLEDRHHSSQLINFTFLRWAYFSLYYLTTNMNDCSVCRSSDTTTSSMCHNGAKQHSHCGEPFRIQKCFLPLRCSLLIRPLSGIFQKLRVFRILTNICGFVGKWIIFLLLKSCHSWNCGKKYVFQQTNQNSEE